MSITRHNAVINITKHPVLIDLIFLILFLYNSAEELTHDWAELDKNVPEAETLGRRLAVCNMDWDRIKARDIFVLLHSFVPTGGTLKSVKVSLLIV